MGSSTSGNSPSKPSTSIVESEIKPTSADQLDDKSPSVDQDEDSFNGEQHPKRSHSSTSGLGEAPPVLLLSMDDDDSTLLQACPADTEPLDSLDEDDEAELAAALKGKYLRERIQQEEAEPAMAAFLHQDVRDGGLCEDAQNEDGKLHKNLRMLAAVGLRAKEARDCDSAILRERSLRPTRGEFRGMEELILDEK